MTLTVPGTGVPEKLTALPVAVGTLAKGVPMSWTSTSGVSSSAELVDVMFRERTAVLDVTVPPVGTTVLPSDWYCVSEEGAEGR